MHARTWSLAAAEHHAEAQGPLLRLVLCRFGAGRNMHHAQRRVAAMRAAQAREEAADDVMTAHTLAALPLHNLMLACGRQQLRWGSGEAVGSVTAW